MEAKRKTEVMSSRRVVKGKRKAQTKRENEGSDVFGVKEVRKGQSKGKGRIGGD